MAPGNCLDRANPVCCGAVEDFLRQRHLQQHRQKVQASRSTIPNKWSEREETKIQASRRNVKREQQQDARFAEIERENLRLLSRMQSIERRGPAKAAAELALGSGGGGAAALGKHAATRSSSVPCGGSSSSSGALGAGAALAAMARGAGSHVSSRVKELRRIDEENQRMLKRLQGAKSTVSMDKFNTDHQRQQKFMRMRCENQTKEEREAARVANAAIKLKLFNPRPPTPGPMDEAFQHLMKLQEDLRAKLGEPGADQDAAAGDENIFLDEAPDSSRLASAREQQRRALEDIGTGITNEEGGGSSGSDQKPADVDAEGGEDHQVISCGGIIPSHSKKIVEELMAMHAKEAQHAEDLEAEAEEAKLAAALAFEKAASLDVASRDYETQGFGAAHAQQQDDLLGYRHFIQRSVPAVPC